MDSDVEIYKRYKIVIIRYEFEKSLSMDFWWPALHIVDTLFSDMRRNPAGKIKRLLKEVVPSVNLRKR